MVEDMSHRREQHRVNRGTSGGSRHYLCRLESDADPQLHAAFLDCEVRVEREQLARVEVMRELLRRGRYIPNLSLIAMRMIRDV